MRPEGYGYGSLETLWVTSGEVHPPPLPGGGSATPHQAPIRDEGMLCMGVVWPEERTPPPRQRPVGSLCRVPLGRGGAVLLMGAAGGAPPLHRCTETGRWTLSISFSGFFDDHRRGSLPPKNNVFLKVCHQGLDGLL